MGAFPAVSVAAGEPVYRLTRFRGGVTQAARSERWVASPDELAQAVREHAQRVLEDKGQATYFLDALTQGKRRDQDVQCWTGETGDVDGVPGHDWHQLVEAIDRAGLGAVLWRSSSHTPEAPRWRCSLAFAEPVGYEHSKEAKEEWARQRAWLLGYLSGLAGLPGVGKHYGDEGKDGPACGFDLRGKAGPGQPVYLPARKREDQQPSEVRVLSGGPLDLPAFLEATGYAEARAAWLEAEASKPAPTPRARAAGPAGDPSAAVARLPEAARAACEAWAGRWAAAYAACGDRHAVGLAVGGFLGRQGIAATVAGDLVELLAGKAGMGGGRGRTAAYSARNALGGGSRTAGLPSVARLLGDEAAAGLADLAAELGGNGDERDEAPPGKPLPVAEPAKRAREDREAKSAPAFDHAAPGAEVSHERQAAETDRLLTGRRERPLVLAGGTGTGKTTGLAAAVGRNQNAAGTTWIAAERHSHHAEEILPKLLEAGVAEADVGIYRPFECDLPGETGQAKEARWRLYTSLGWSPTRFVCVDCPRFSEEAERPCSFWSERRRAQQAPIRLTMHAHAGLVGAKPGDRLVFDEDPSGVLAEGAKFTQDELERFADALKKLEGNAMRLEREKGKKGEKWRRIKLAARAASAAAGTFAEVFGKPGGWYRVGQPEGLDPLRDPERVRELAVKLASDRCRNLLPFFGELANAPESGLAARRADERSLRELHVTLRREIPGGVHVAVLDATAEPEALARVLGGEPDVIRAPRWSAETGGPVYQLRERVRGREKSRKRLKQDAAVIARWVAREALKHPERAVVVGIVTLAELEEPLRKAVLAAWRRLRDGSREIRDLPTPTVLTRHWWALRGSNELGGVDVGVVHTAPIPPAEELVRVALLFDPDADLAELEKAAGAARCQWLRYRGSRTRALVHEHPALAAAWRATVEAELRQGIGRFDRGQGHPSGGTLVMTSLPFRGGEVTPATVAELGLRGGDRKMGVPAFLGRAKSEATENAGDRGGPSRSSSYSYKNYPEPDPETVEEGVALMGGVKPLASALGVTPKAVRKWREGGGISPDHHASVVALVEREIANRTATPTESDAPYSAGTESAPAALVSVDLDPPDPPLDWLAIAPTQNRSIGTLTPRLRPPPPGPPDWPTWAREDAAERAAVLEFDYGLPRAEAEARAFDELRRAM